MKSYSNIDPVAVTPPQVLAIFLHFLRDKIVGKCYASYEAKRTIEISISSCTYKNRAWLSSKQQGCAIDSFYIYPELKWATLSFKVNVEKRKTKQKIAFHFFILPLRRKELEKQRQIDEKKQLKNFQWQLS